MKTISSQLAAHLHQPTTNLCRLLKLTRADGTIYRYTDFDQPIVDFVESVTETHIVSASSWSANPSPPSSVPNASPWTSYWSLTGDAMTSTRDTSPNPDGSGFAVTYAGGKMTVTGIDFDSICDIGSVLVAIGTRPITYTANLTFSDTQYQAYHTWYHGHWAAKFGLSDGVLWAATDRYVGFAVDWVAHGNNNIHLRSNVSGSGGPSTDIDTGISSAANHNYKFTINAAGTLVTWYIDGISVGTSSNVPDYNVPMVFWWEVSAIYCTESFIVASVSCEYENYILVTPHTGTYSPLDGATFSALELKDDGSPDNLTVTLFADDSGISESDVRARRFDNATFELCATNWADPTMGGIKLLSGTVGDFKIEAKLITIELRGLTQFLTTQIGSVYSPSCLAEIFGGGASAIPIDVKNHWKCRLNRDDFFQSGVVASSPDSLTIVPATPVSYSVSQSAITSNVAAIICGGTLPVDFVGANFTFSGLTSATALNGQTLAVSQENAFGQGINSVAISGDVLTLNVGADFTPFIGAILTLSGLTTATFLNGRTITVATVPTNTTFTAAFTHTDYATHADTGTATLVQQLLFPFTSANAVAGADTGTLSSADSGYSSPAFTMRGSPTTPTAAAPVGWFADGLITFTSGNLSGCSYEISQWDGATLTLFAGAPMPFAPSPGSTFDIEPGCNKTKARCLALGNIVNYAGFAEIPGLNVLAPANSVPQVTT